MNFTKKVVKTDSGIYSWKSPLEVLLADGVQPCSWLGRCHRCDSFSRSTCQGDLSYARFNG